MLTLAKVRLEIAKTTEKLTNLKTESERVKKRPLPWNVKTKMLENLERCRKETAAKLSSLQSEAKYLRQEEIEARSDTFQNRFITIARRVLPYETFTAIFREAEGEAGEEYDHEAHGDP